MSKKRQYRKFHGNVRIPCLAWAFLLAMVLALAACDGIGTFELGFFREPFTKAWLLCAPVIGCITVWSK